MPSLIIYSIQYISNSATNQNKSSMINAANLGERLTRAVLQIDLAVLFSAGDHIQVSK